MNQRRAENDREPDFRHPRPTEPVADADPFHDSPGETVPYLDVAIERLLASVMQAVTQSERVVLLQGPQGIGKSTLLLGLLERITEPTQACAFAAREGTTPQAVENTLRQTWAGAMGLRANAPGSAILNALCLRGLHPLIMIDDAQRLSPAALEELLRLRQDAIKGCRAPPGLLLAGDTDLQTLLDTLPEESRLGLDIQRVTVPPLTLEQTEAYLAHRLIQGGQQHAIADFRRQAAAIHEKSAGIPQKINSVARTTPPPPRDTSARSRFLALPTLPVMPNLRLRFSPSLLLILLGAAILTALLVVAGSWLTSRHDSALPPTPDNAQPRILSTPDVPPDPPTTPTRSDSSPPLARTTPAADGPDSGTIEGSERPRAEPDAALVTATIGTDPETAMIASDTLAAPATIAALQREQQELLAELAAQSAMLEPALSFVAQRVRLAHVLQSEFSDAWFEWNAEFDPNALVIEFRSPNALWRAGELNLQPRYRNLINDFFTRLAPLLEPFREHIQEIRLEGHTSSGWRGTDDETQAFFNNLQLSQDRTRALLSQLYGLPALADERAWIRNRLTAIGLSSAYPILDTAGLEDAQRSRRISVRIILDAQPMFEALSGQSP